MANKKYGKKRTIPHRRKRDTRTNYKKRLALLKSGKLRLVLRKTIKTIIVQLVQYNPDGDKVLITATSKELVKLGWKAHTANMPSAYLTGLLVAMKAKKANFKEAILDVGLQSPAKGSKLYAALKGAVDGGLNIAHDPIILPSDERIQGKHIADFAATVKQDEKYASQFADCIKNGLQPEQLTSHFEEIKKKVMEL